MTEELLKKIEKNRASHAAVTRMMQYIRSKNNIVEIKNGYGDKINLTPKTSQIICDELQSMLNMLDSEFKNM